MTVRLIHPFTACLAGPSCCGKTSFTLELIKNLHRLCSVPVFDAIVWCVNEPSSLPREIKQLVSIVHKGIPKFENVNGKPKLFILDDLMQEA
jgi:hypothetical protein